MLIYLRHTDDEYNSATYLYDKKVTAKGARQMKRFTDKLVKKYGLPDIIYSSPFRRCRYSVKFVLRHLRKKYNHHPRIEIDSRLSRYFTSKEKQNPDISHNTAIYNVPIYETWKDFRKRTKNAIDEYDKYKNMNDKVWVMTHTLVIREACRHYNLDFPRWIPFLYKVEIK